MVNLRALVYGKNLNHYQKSLALKEFEKLETSVKEANLFIIQIANLLKMDTDGVGFDGIQFSIDDFEEAIKAMENNLFCNCSVATGSWVCGKCHKPLPHTGKTPQ